MSDKRLTMKDIAEMAKVSTAAVSMALNGKPGVSEETRAKIFHIANQHDYVININAKSLKTNENSLIGVIIPDIQNPFFSWLVDHLNDAISKAGFTMLLSISGDEVESDLIKELCSRGVQGIILVPSFSQDKIKYNFFDVPLTICTVSSEGKYSSVACDIKEGEFLLTRHLMKQYTHFAFVGNRKDAWITNERFTGLMNAFQTKNKEQFVVDFYKVESPSYIDGYKVAKEILQKKPEVILCINDVLALGILKYCLEHDIAVPKDIALAGFDDLWVSSLISPQLTTVRQPVEKIAEKSVEVLLEQMSGEIRGKIRNILIKPDLVIRQTT